MGHLKAVPSYQDWLRATIERQQEQQDRRFDAILENIDGQWRVYGRKQLELDNLRAQLVQDEHAPEEKG